MLLQADLTAVAPGPLTPDLDRELWLAADVESRGGATVFRFTPESVRRALDAGRSGDDLLAWLTRASRTPVPQPLAYLVQDTARRYGRIRIGTAQCYVRGDDEGALAELLADRRTAALRLRRLAPTVLAAQAPPETVLSVLRGMGLAPAAESADGDVVVRAPRTHRTPPRSRPRPVTPLPPAPGEAALLSAVQALRAADEAAASRAAGRADVVDVGPPPVLAATDPARRWRCSGTPQRRAGRCGSGTRTQRGMSRAASSSRSRSTPAGSRRSTAGPKRSGRSRYTA